MVPAGSEREEEAFFFAVFLFVLLLLPLPSQSSASVRVFVLALSWCFAVHHHVVPKQGFVLFAVGLGEFGVGDGDLFASDRRSSH